MAWHPFRNLGLKVVAVVLGALLWFTVSGAQVDRTVTGVPVVYRNKPAGLEITEQTNVVDIHVRGLDSQLRSAMARDFEARVDLTGARAGLQPFTVRTDQVSAPPGLEVTQVEPSTVTAMLELTGMVSVPVRPRVEGSPAPGFVVAQIAAEPPTVMITGPARRISSATVATTDRVEIDGAKATVTANVSVGVRDGSLRLRDTTKARVVVTIEPAGDRLFAALRVAVRNLRQGAKVIMEPAIVSVQVHGARTLLGRLDARTVVPYVDVLDLGPGRHELPVLIDLGGTIAAAARPATVTVTIN